PLVLVLGWGVGQWSSLRPTAAVLGLAPMRRVLLLKAQGFQEEDPPMTTLDLVTELFFRIDEAMKDVPKHAQAALYPREVVTLAFMFAIKGVGTRPFYRWLARDWQACFPQLPERTRLFRLFNTHRQWTERFLAEPTIFGVIDTYGIE